MHIILLLFLFILFIVVGFYCGLGFEAEESVGGRKANLEAELAEDFILPLDSYRNTPASLLPSEVKKDLIVNEAEYAYELPRSDDQTQLTLAVTDAHWLFAYWKVSEEKKGELIRRYGVKAWEESYPVLRVHDLTESEQGVSGEFYDLYIDDYANSWYLHVGKPQHSFYAELGRMMANGLFIVIAKSNTVTTPPERFSNTRGEECVRSDGIYHRDDVHAGTSLGEHLK